MPNPKEEVAHEPLLNAHAVEGQDGQVQFGAVTIDTQVLDTNSYDFDGGWLAQLKQFRGGKVRLVLSELVVREGLRHLRDRIIQTRDALDKTHRKGILYGLLGKDDVPKVKAVDPVAAAKEMMDRFIEETGAIVLPLEGVSTGKLFEMYEQGLAPFAGKGKKKSEFPDAIALLTLGDWADREGCNLLAVSGDGDWSGFSHVRMQVVAGLDTALPMLQTEAERAVQIFRTALAQLRDCTTALGASFDQLLTDAVADHEIEPSASSAYMAEPEGGSASLKGFEFPEDADEYTVVQAGGGTIVVQVSLEIVVDATADFSMSIYDSIDRDYVPMGTTSAMVSDEELSIEVLITLGMQSGRGFTLDSVEIVGGAFYLDFGNVEIEFGDPYEERW